MLLSLLFALVLPLCTYDMYICACGVCIIWVYLAFKVSSGCFAQGFCTLFPPSQSQSQANIVIRRRLWNEFWCDNPMLLPTNQEREQTVSGWIVAILNAHRVTCTTQIEWSLWLLFSSFQTHIILHIFWMLRATRHGMYFWISWSSCSCHRLRQFFGVSPLS